MSNETKNRVGKKIVQRKAREGGCVGECLCHETYRRRGGRKAISGVLGQRGSCRFGAFCEARRKRGRGGAKEGWAKARGGKRKRGRLDKERERYRVGNQAGKRKNG